MRWTTPVHHVMRTATADVELAGQQVARGDWIMLNYLSANRDEAAFDEPERFRLNRKTSRSALFGQGVHTCLGQHLARLEMRIFFEELLSRVGLGRNCRKAAGARRRSSSAGQKCCRSALKCIEMAGAVEPELRQSDLTDHKSVVS